MSSVEKDTEEIAKRMSNEQTGSDSMWELFLTDAYQEYYKLNQVQDDANQPEAVQHD